MNQVLIWKCLKNTDGQSPINAYIQKKKKKSCNYTLILAISLNKIIGWQVIEGGG